MDKGVLIRSRLRSSLIELLTEWIQENNEDISEIAGFVGPQVENCIASSAIATLSALGDKEKYMEKENLLNT